MDELSRNGSGYYDPTASPVLHAIHKREQAANEDANRIIKLIKDLLSVSRSGINQRGGNTDEQRRKEAVPSQIPGSKEKGENDSGGN